MTILEIEKMEVSLKIEAQNAGRNFLLPTKVDFTMKLRSQQMRDTASRYHDTNPGNYALSASLSIPVLSEVIWQR